MATTTKTLNKMWRVTMLKQVVKRWKSISLKRKILLSNCDSDSASSSRNIPAGFLAVYVGQDRIRFLIPTRFLNLPIFASLLEKAEEEYGFGVRGGLALPCEVEFFEQVLKLLYKDEKKYGSLEVDKFLKLISEVSLDSSSACRERNNFLVPLLQKVGA